MDKTTNNAFAFRRFLEQTYIERVKNNSQYSIRSFAKSLEINNSTLSQILNGKRVVTANRIKSIGLKLGLSLSEINNFLEEEDSKVLFTQDSVEAYEIQSEWYYDALIELVRTDNFVFDAQVIADQFDLSPNLIQIAFKKLIKYNIIEERDGEYLCNSEFTTFAFDDADWTSKALKDYQKNLLEISKKSVDRFERGERNHTSFVTRMDKKLLPEVQKKICEFQRELIEFIENNGESFEDVYAIQIANFPLAIKEKNTKVENTSEEI